MTPVLHTNTRYTYREFTWPLADARFAVEAGYGCGDDIEVMMVARRT